MSENRYGKPRDYDEQRKKNTIKILKDGIRYLQTLKKFENKPISVYALSQYTGIKRSTIDNYPEIKKMLDSHLQMTKTVELKTAAIKIENIHNLEQAVMVIEVLKDMYNDTKDKYNDLLKENTKLNLRISRLTMENNELKKYLK